MSYDLLAKHENRCALREEYQVAADYRAAIRAARTDWQISVTIAAAAALSSRPRQM
jgi:hypothetical protein